jgi:predicted alpha/beta hydrolase
MPMRSLGAGEDLPMGVYRVWKRWCSFPNYFFDDPQARAITAPYAHVNVPIVAVAATDDLWAPPASASEVVRIDLSPESVGTHEIGHMGYFRQSVGTVLWPRALASLSRFGLRPNAAG